MGSLTETLERVEHGSPEKQLKMFGRAQRVFPKLMSGQKLRSGLSLQTQGLYLRKYLCVVRRDCDQWAEPRYLLLSFYL